MKISLELFYNITIFNIYIPRTKEMEESRCISIILFCHEMHLRTQNMLIIYRKFFIKYVAPVDSSLYCKWGRIMHPKFHMYLTECTVELE